MNQVTVKGMTCQHCVNHVTETLTELGLEQVVVDLDTGKASFSTQEKLRKEDIAKAIVEAGYEVE